MMENKKIFIFSKDESYINWVKSGLPDLKYEVKVFNSNEYYIIYEDNLKTEPLILVSDLDDFIDTDRIQSVIGSILKTFPFIYIIGFSTIEMDFSDERFNFIKKSSDNLPSFSLILKLVSKWQNTKIELSNYLDYPEKITLEITKDTKINVKIKNFLNEAFSRNYPCNAKFEITEPDIDCFSQMNPEDVGSISVYGEMLFVKLIKDNISLLSLLGTSCKENPLSTHSLEIRSEKNLLRVPFEILYNRKTPENGFYYALDRPLTRSIPKYETSSNYLSLKDYTKQDTLRFLLLSVNPNNDLNFIENEINELENIIKVEFSKFCKVEVISRSESSIERQQLSDLIINNGIDIFHFAGHSKYYELEPDKSGLLINKKKFLRNTIEEYFSTEDLKKTLSNSGVKFVFLNSCRSSEFSSKSKLSNNNFLGISDSILSSGVRTVLGYRWMINDRNAYVFAKTFYENLALTKSFGKAILKSRELNKFNKTETNEWASSILITQEI